MPRLEFLACLKVVSRKVPKGLRQKASLSKGLLKRTTAKIFVPINTHESRFSKSTERIKSKNISLGRLFKAQDSSILLSRLLELSVGKSRCKCLHILFQNCFVIFTTVSGMSAPKKVLLLERTKTSFGSRETLKETYLGPFETASQENYLLCVYRDFSVGD